MAALQQEINGSKKQKGDPKMNVAMIDRLMIKSAGGF
jgi:hypothetical protein